MNKVLDRFTRIKAFGNRFKALEAINAELKELLGMKNTTIEVEFIEYNGSFSVSIESAITLNDLKKISEYFGTNEIDIDGNHGEGSYDFGFEAELRIYNPTKSILK